MPENGKKIPNIHFERFKVGQCFNLHCYHISTVDIHKNFTFN